MKTGLRLLKTSKNLLLVPMHPSYENLTEGFTLSRFLTLLEEDADLAVGVRRSAPKTLDEAVREATRLDGINQTVEKAKKCQPSQVLWL